MRNLHGKIKKKKTKFISYNSNFISVTTAEHKFIYLYKKIRSQREVFLIENYTIQHDVTLFIFYIFFL